MELRAETPLEEELLLSYQLLKRELAAVLLGHDMLLSEYRALKVLEGGGVPLGQVASRLGLTAATLTTLARGMQTHRWVVIVRDTKDRRASILKATTTGLRALRAARQDCLRQMRRLENGMSGEDRRHLAQGLHSLLHQLEASSLRSGAARPE